MKCDRNVSADVKCAIMFWQNIVGEASLVVLPNYIKHLHQSTPISQKHLITSQIIFLPRLWAHEVSLPFTITQSSSLLQWRAAEADSCIKQYHPLTLEPLRTHSLETNDRWRLGVCWGNNNLKGLSYSSSSFSLFYFAHILSLSLFLPPCWALSVVLVNVLLSCLDVIYVTGCEVDLSPSSPNSLPPPPSPPLHPVYGGSQPAWLLQQGQGGEVWVGGGREGDSGGVRGKFQASTCPVKLWILYPHACFNMGSNQ